MKIGWIGTGVMGASMARHVQKDKHDLYVYNRTRQKAAELLKAGAQWCDSPREVADQAEIVFTIVGFPSDVDSVYSGEEGIFSGEAGVCRIAVDMTTSEPSQAEALAREAEKRGMAFLDAPVSGGDVGAEEGTLAIMAGGDEKAFAEVKPLFELMGKNIAHMGPAGAGQHTKMCNQILIATTMIGTCESLLYAAKAGLDRQAVIDIIGKGAAGSWSINTLGPRIAKEDMDPGFYVEHFIKDMGIALREAAALNLSLPGLALAHQLYVGVQALGHGRSGTQALVRALEALSGLSHWG